MFKDLPKLYVLDYNFELQVIYKVRIIHNKNETLDLTDEFELRRCLLTQDRVQDFAFQFNLIFHCPTNFTLSHAENPAVNTKENPAYMELMLIVYTI